MSIGSKEILLKTYRAFSPIVMVGVASPILIVMVTVFYIMKE